MKIHEGCIVRTPRGYRAEVKELKTSNHLTAKVEILSGSFKGIEREEIEWWNPEMLTFLASADSTAKMGVRAREMASEKVQKMPLSPKSKETLEEEFRRFGERLLSEMRERGEQIDPPKPEPRKLDEVTLDTINLVEDARKSVEKADMKLEKPRWTEVGGGQVPQIKKKYGEKIRNVFTELNEEVEEAKKKAEQRLREMREEF